MASLLRLFSLYLVACPRHVQWRSTKYTRATFLLTTLPSSPPLASMKSMFSAPISPGPSLPRKLLNSNSVDGFD